MSRRRRGLQAVTAACRTAITLMFARSSESGSAPSSGIPNIDWHIPELADIDDASTPEWDVNGLMGASPTALTKSGDWFRSEVKAHVSGAQARLAGAWSAPLPTQCTEKTGGGWCTVRAIAEPATALVATKGVFFGLGSAGDRPEIGVVTGQAGASATVTTIGGISGASSLENCGTHPHANAPQGYATLPIRYGATVQVCDQRVGALAWDPVDDDYESAAEIRAGLNDPVDKLAIGAAPIASSSSGGVGVVSGRGAFAFAEGFAANDPSLDAAGLAAAGWERMDLTWFDSASPTYNTAEAGALTWSSANGFTFTINGTGTSKASFRQHAAWPMNKWPTGHDPKGTTRVMFRVLARRADMPEITPGTNATGPQIALGVCTHDGDVTNVSAHAGGASIKATGGSPNARITQGGMAIANQDLGTQFSGTGDFYGYMAPDFIGPIGDINTDAVQGAGIHGGWVFGTEDAGTNYTWNEHGDADELVASDGRCRPILAAGYNGTETGTVTWVVDIWAKCVRVIPEGEFDEAAA